MTVIVVKVAIKSPPIRAIAIGVKKELFAKISGISPNIVVTELNKIGRIRLETEDLQASNTSSPSALALSIYSINKIPLLTTIPIKLAAPSPTVKVKFVLVKSNAAMMPIIAKSTVAMMTKGLIKELNCTNNMM